MTPHARLTRIVSNLQLAATLAEAIHRREADGKHGQELPTSVLVTLQTSAASISDILLVAEQMSRNTKQTQ